MQRQSDNEHEFKFLGTRGGPVFGSRGFVPRLETKPGSERVGAASRSGISAWDRGVFGFLPAKARRCDSGDGAAFYGGNDGTGTSVTRDGGALESSVELVLPNGASAR